MNDLVNIKTSELSALPSLESSLDASFGPKRRPGGRKKALHLNDPPGKVNNPTGKPSNGLWQDPGPRARVLLERFGHEKILQMAEEILEKKKTDLSTGDALLVCRMARALKDGVELERLYDRTFGKVPDRAINLNVNVETDPQQLSDKAMALLGKLSDD